MNKKLIAAILAATTALSAAPFALAENDENTNDKVEIAFNVGDSILKINGIETEVETPYVTENNTTLVPLRVITEAFGAKVDWDGDTQKITLTYPAVNIELQIGNIVATVNDHTETLLESPALSENGVTMVPLRFISETFGATVGYDNDTQAILVTKENMDNSSTVTGITDMTKTGDSYYLWSIDTPTQMKMADRTLDAMTTKFVADDESSMYIDVYPITEDTVDFDEEYSKRKDSFSSYTLINAEKLPESNGTQHMHFQAKNKEQIIDFHDYRYLITSLIKINDDTSTKDMILSLVDSFKIGKIDNETYDLSTVKTEGTRQYREITDDTYKVSFYVPANYQMEDDNTENEFTFYEPKNESTSHISLGIYSKTGDTTAYSLATHDHAIREKYASTKYSTLTPVSETGTNSYKYTQTISGSTDSDLYTVDTFFEKGDYVYNFAVTTNLDYDEMELNTILNSIKAEELDSSKIGKLMRNDPEDTLNTAKVGDYQFSIPASWKLFSKASQGSSYTNVSYVNTYTTSGIIYASMTGSDFKQTNLSTVANSYSKSITQDDEHEMFKKVEYTSINGKRYAYFTYTTTSKADNKSYGTVYMTCDNGTAHIFTLIQNEVFYGSAEIDDFIDIVNSFQSK